MTVSSKKGSYKRRFQTIISAMILAILALMPGVGGPAKAADRPLVLAHYMPWFAAKPVSPGWGWHWTMNACDPDKVKEGRREIASHYYPLIGPYDSGDPNVIEYHLLLMKLAGIDGVIVDWYGTSNYADYASIHRNTGRLFEAARQLHMRFAICYEDQTVPALEKAGKLTSSERVPHVRQIFDWLRGNWFRDPAYLRIDGKPVALSFGSGGLTDAEWSEALKDDNRQTMYISENYRRPAAAGAFDWPEPSQGLAALDRFYTETRDLDVRIPVAFPRFRDAYKLGKARDGYPDIPDDDGNTYSRSFKRAWTSGAPAIQLATWNDWGEGTNIEPSVEFGYRDLEVIQESRRKSDPSFRPRADDLRLPFRLWTLRLKQKQDAGLVEGLNRASQFLSAGDCAAAGRLLAELEHRK